MEKTELFYESSDKETTIRAVRYLPAKKPVAVLQIAHGMVEFIDRYEGFADYLCSKGFVVTGNDHLGHGFSVTSQNKWGYFSKENGYENVLEDMHNLTVLTKKDFPDVPYFLLGHSMGSFFARYYLTKYGKELNAAIIMGTGYQAASTVNAGKMVCKLLALFKGWEYRSSFVNNMALGSYNKKWEPSKTHNDWLTKDEDVVNWYSNEPRCTFTFTLNGYYNLFGVLGEIVKNEQLMKMPKSLPVLFVSGEDDPVGEFGKGVNEVFDLFSSIGMENITKKLYPNDRHEILNELDKAVVMTDIYSFLSPYLLKPVRAPRTRANKEKNSDKKEEKAVKKAASNSDKQKPENKVAAPLKKKPAAKKSASKTVTKKAADTKKSPAKNKVNKETKKTKTVSKKVKDDKKPVKKTVKKSQTKKEVK